MQTAAAEYKKGQQSSYIYHCFSLACNRLMVKYVVCRPAGPEHQAQGCCWSAAGSGCWCRRSAGFSRTLWPDTLVSTFSTPSSQNTCHVSCMQHACRNSAGHLSACFTTVHALSWLPKKQASCGQCGSCPGLELTRVCMYVLQTMCSACGLDSGCRVTAGPWCLGPQSNPDTGHGHALGCVQG